MHHLSAIASVKRGVSLFSTKAKPVITGPVMKLSCTVGLLLSIFTGDEYHSLGDFGFIWGPAIQRSEHNSLPSNPYKLKQMLCGGNGVQHITNNCYEITGALAENEIKKQLPCIIAILAMRFPFIFIMTNEIYLKPSNYYLKYYHTSEPIPYEMVSAFRNQIEIKKTFTEMIDKASSPEISHSLNAGLSEALRNMRENAYYTRREKLRTLEANLKIILSQNGIEIDYGLKTTTNVEIEVFNEIEQQEVIHLMEVFPNLLKLEGCELIKGLYDTMPKLYPELFQNNVEENTLKFASKM